MEDIGSNMQSIMTRERTTKGKKHLLFSDQVENKKQVLQEYIDSVCVSHSKDNGINVKLNVRVFDGGGEGICTPVSKSCHKSIYACILQFKFRQS